jgi:hypothetical protein
MRLREAIRVSERWAAIAPSPPRSSSKVESVASMEAAGEIEPVRPAA